jgi:predicted dehydrogenase
VNDTADRSPRFRVGLVGCGSIAAELEDLLRSVPGYFLFPYGQATLFVRHPRTELVAVADPDAARRDAIADRFGVARRYETHRQLLDDVEIDIVAVAAPTRFHAEITVDAAGAGVKGVFLEKPVAETLGDADAMIAACARAGTATVVNHFRSFDPLWRRAMALVHDGEIGELTAASAVWGEGLAQGGCHLLDYLRLVTGSTVAWVQAHVEPDDVYPDPGGSFILGYASGVRAVVHMEWRTKAPPQLELLGAQGMIRLGNFEIRRWRFESVSERVIPVELPFPARHDGASAMIGALDELIDAVERGTRPASTLADGRAALETTLAILASGHARARVDLPFGDPTARAVSWL